MTVKSLMGVTRRDVQELAGGRCYADDVEPDLFFPDGRIGPAAVAQVQSAQDVCRLCPVREACLEQAEARGEKHGVWGGKDFDTGKDFDNRCGSPAGYSRHRRNKKRPCGPCRDAKNARKRELRKKATA